MGNDGMRGGLIFSRYPVRVEIHEKVGRNTTRLFMDWGRFVFKKKTGETHFQLKRKGVKLPPPDNEYLRHDRKGRLYLQYDSPSPAEFIPIIPFDTPSAETYNKLNQQNIRWARQSMQEAINRWNKQSVWLQNFPLIVIAVAVILAVVMLSVAVDKQNDIATKSLSLADQQQQATMVMAEAFNRFADIYAGDYSQGAQKLNISKIGT